MLLWKWLSRWWQVGCKMLPLVSQTVTVLQKRHHWLQKAFVWTNSNKIPEVLVRFLSSYVSVGSSQNSAWGSQRKNKWSSAVQEPGFSNQIQLYVDCCDGLILIPKFWYVHSYNHILWFALLHVFNIWIEMSFLGLLKYNRALWSPQDNHNYQSQFSMNCRSWCFSVCIYNYAHTYIHLSQET